jgi:ubiquinone/menaquinone biosynthesis C-methylase UbiE
MSVGDVWQFEWVAPLYDRFIPPVDPSTFDRAFELAGRPIERVLDVGGGTGRGARVVTAPRRVVVDPASRMTNRARDHELEAVRADGSRLPIRETSVDAVLIVDALHHIADRRGALAEAYRVLRPGGVLIVVEFDPSTVRGRLLVAGEGLLGFDSTFEPPASLRERLGEAGFEVAIPDRGFDYTAVGQKPSDSGSNSGTG